MSLAARFSGICERCDERFEVGAEITKTADGWGHVSCPDVLAITAPVCGRCFLTRPCEHDEDS